VCGLRAEEEGIFKSDDDYKYSFQVLQLSQEEAIISPTF
jgi:hypothetical protein